MYCPKCGNEIKENQKFCTNCGEKFSDDIPKTNNKNMILISCFYYLLVVGVMIGFFINNNSKQNSEQIETIKEEITQEVTQKTPAEISEEVNSYQARYFEIVKRNDVLLGIVDDASERDMKELNNLFKEVESKINPDNQFFKEYKDIKNRFKENPGESTVEMNEFASQGYDKVDKLLNKVYKAVKEELSPEDFENVKIAQRTWLKEVLAYNEVFEAQGFGSISFIIKADYEINMRSFRTLLLMLYITEPAQVCQSCYHKK